MLDQVVNSLQELYQRRQISIEMASLEQELTDLQFQLKSESDKHSIMTARLNRCNKLYNV